ncbi:hypothetical protein N8659_00425 [bacterium]|nr:hypothetical protein [Akkermansiaceae bacterium]MDA7513882.1 hypothetical protein [bacterium]MDA7513168.1 hypothetical protein [Akkermansiaceae bacterium]MDA7534250.1 hypothetical protein [bacterium]MDA7611792.1 hypothetical protein [bacterium]
MTKRILASIFGAILFEIVSPLGYYLCFEAVPSGEGELKGLV